MTHINNPSQQLQTLLSANSRLDQTIQVRISEAQKAELDRLVEELSLRYPTKKITTSDLVRAAIQQVIDGLREAAG